MKKVPRWPLAFSLILLAAPGSADAPANRYAVAAGTVTDTKTGLVWQQPDAGMTLTWSAAKTYCASLGSGWRLPTAKELQTIVDDSHLNPSIDPNFFPGTASASYWSATPVSGSSIGSLGVSFSYGNAYGIYRTDSNPVRCVR